MKAEAIVVAETVRRFNEDLQREAERARKLVEAGRETTAWNGHELGHAEPDVDSMIRRHFTFLLLQDAIKARRFFNSPGLAQLINACLRSIEQADDAVMRQWNEAWEAP